MKPTNLVALAAIFALGCSHGGFEVPITRTIASQTIPGDPTAHQLATSGALSTDQRLNVEWKTTQAPTDTTGATWVALSALTLTAEAPADGSATPCWDFVDSVTVSIESNTQGSTLPPVQVAHATTPGCVTTLTLDTEPSIDLGPYVNQGFTLVVTAHGIPPAQNVTFHGSYTVTLSVL